MFTEILFNVVSVVQDARGGQNRKIVTDFVFYHTNCLYKLRSYNHTIYYRPQVAENMHVATIINF